MSRLFFKYVSFFWIYAFFLSLKDFPPLNNVDGRDELSRVPKQI